MGDKKKIVFIINPKSGVRKKKRVEKAINRFLDHGLFDKKIIYTEYPQHATEIARRESEAGADIVVAVGGDGSANEVARGLIGSRSVMGLIPVGSGNGLALYLKIPLILKFSIGIINRQRVRRIDTATFNDKMFVSIAGVGFDALVAHEFSHCRRRGFFSYLNIILRRFPKYRPGRFRISFGDISLARRAIMISFANSDQFGFNASIAPEAKINDGMLDMCIVRPVSVFSALFMANKLFLKNFDLSKNVEIYKVKNATIESTTPVYSQVDGDPMGLVNAVSVSIQPKSLSIIVP